EVQPQLALVVPGFVVVVLDGAQIVGDSHHSQRSAPTLTLPRKRGREMEQKKSGRRGNADRSKPNRALLADVLPSFRLVWRRCAADVQEVLGPADDRDLQGGIFHGRGLIVCFTRAALKCNGGLHSYIVH